MTWNRIEFDEISGQCRAKCWSQCTYVILCLASCSPTTLKDYLTHIAMDRGKAELKVPAMATLWCIVMLGVTVFQNPTCLISINLEARMFKIFALQHSSLRRWRPLWKEKKESDLMSSLTLKCSWLGEHRTITWEKTWDSLTADSGKPGMAIHCGALCKCFMLLCEAKRVSHRTLFVLHPAQPHTSDDRHLGSCRNGFNAEQREIFEDLIIGVQRKQVLSWAVGMCHGQKPWRIMEVQNENSQTMSDSFTAGPGDLGAHCSDWWGGSGPKAQQSQNSQEQGGIGSVRLMESSQTQPKWIAGWVAPICFRLISVASAWCNMYAYVMNVSLP